MFSYKYKKIEKHTHKKKQNTIINKQGTLILTDYQLKKYERKEQKTIYLMDGYKYFN